MGTITSGVGLVSGIDTNSIINQLMALETQPKTMLQSRVTGATAQKQAYTDLATSLQGLQTIGQALERPTTFTTSTATSSDQSVLTATAGPGAPSGSYQFQVARLVSAQQSISNGFSSSTSLAGAGTMTISLGGGDLKSPTTLAQLNGGAGVSRGQFRISDRSGKSSVIDVSGAVTLDDVVKKINTALDVSVRASIDKDHLVLTDTSGQTSSNLIVQDLGDGHTAADLGIVQSSATSTITGTSLTAVGANTALATLNDGRGLRTASGGADFRVALADGSTVDVNLSGSQTLGDVIKSINTAGGTKLKASLNTANNSIDLSDATASNPANTHAFTVSSLNNSQAAADLGFTAAGSGGAIHGKTLSAGIDTVMLSSLNGGSGLPLGTIQITDRLGNASNPIDLSGAKTVQDVLDAINQSGVGVTASLNDSGTGLQLQDTTGGAKNLIVSDVNSTTAASLGLAGSFDTNTTTVKGSNLHFQWVSENTLLSSYNGGKGVTPGTFKITNSKGTSATVDMSSGTFTKIGDVISAINAKALGVTASINANGNGILLTDTAGGAGKMSVANVTGTTATDLNIAGTATTNTIDGSFEKTLSISATDTITDVQTKVQALGWGLAAGMVNDGTGVNGYHLSLTATNTGRAGRVVVDGGTTNIKMHNLVDGQDAAVFIGGGGDASQSLLVTSSTNQLANVIPGVTVNLTSASSSPVTLSITRDPSNASGQLQKFTDGFNAIVDKITSLTGFDTAKQQAGLLLGDSTVSTIQTNMYAVVQGVVNGAGQYRMLSDIGLTIGDGAKLSFDQDKFNQAFATDPEAVKNLFTQTTTGLGAVLDSSMTSLVDPVTGAITQENKTIDDKVQQFNDQITQLDSILNDKRTRLQAQFANMESVLAGLQSQQSALASLTGIAPAASSSSSSSKAAA